MKKIHRCILALLISAAGVTGCTYGSGTHGPAPSPETAAATETDKNRTSAEYYYLTSRRLILKGQVESAAQALFQAIEKDPGSAFLKREMIRLLEKQKKTEQALAMAEKLAAQDPENVENLLLLVRLKNNSETDDGMPDLLRRILELDPQNKESYLRLGKIYMENREYDRSLELFTQMVNAFPDYYVAHFYLGEALMLTHRPKEAESAFLKTIDLEPDLVEPRFRLIDILREENGKNTNSRIIQTYEEILEIEPGNDRAVLEMALFFYKTGESDKADSLFAELGQEAKENPRLVMTAVDTFITRQRFQDAVIVFSQLRKADPGNTNLNFFTGMAYEAVEDLEQAIAHYLRVTPDHPQYKKTILSIAFLYRDQGKEAEAVRFLEQHHKQSPRDIDIISYLASFYEDQGSYENAMTLLQKGLKYSPENTVLLFKLGATQDKAGLREACINTMKSVIRLDPAHASALNYLGYTYAEMNIRLEEALDLVQKALDAKPGDGYITDSLGWVYFKLGNYEKAVFYLEKAARISKYDTIIAGHLGDAYVKTGKKARALGVYHKALENAGGEHEKEVKEIEQKIRELEKTAHD